ncbi:hypothetical protein [Micromonospora sp. KC207]|uniref:hypothetical protein n=1 Tax=Micromonospora sp. KC207 TaxID=2530377 RepID=UPI001FB804A2|nr:hypothetical protein [Micromonospora sp. KC207]
MYRSNVVDAFSCPTTRRTTSTGTPSVTSHVMYERRRSCNRSPPTAEAAACATAAVVVAAATIAAGAAAAAGLVRRQHRPDPFVDCGCSPCQ